MTNDTYDEMSRDELLVRVRDWRQLANERSVEITRLQADQLVNAELEVELARVRSERDRLRVVAEAARAACLVFDGEDLDNVSGLLPAAIDRLVADLRAYYVGIGEDPDVWLNQTEEDT